MNYQTETASHTPGPWEATFISRPFGNPGQFADFATVRAPHPDGDGHTYICDCLGLITDPRTRGDYTASDVAIANSRLIAAAPETAKERDRLREINGELLAVLHGILEIGKRDMSNPKYDSYFVAARAAIAKAKGDL